jgi:hypothetical protein
MLSPRYRICVPVVGLIILGWLVLLFAWPGVYEPLMIGTIFGTFLAHTAVAATWAALGPASWHWRMPLSLVWIGTNLIAFTLTLARHDASALAFPLILGASLLGEWFVLQVPLWALAIGYGIRLRHRDDSEQPRSNSSRQFGIRQLMILTASVAIVLGVGRALFSQISEPYLNETIVDLGFIAVVATAITLPLILAALLPRWTVLSVLIVLAIVAVASAWELALYTALGRSGPSPQDFVWINAITCAWVLAFVLVARLNGYRLTTTAYKEASDNLL